MSIDSPADAPPTWSEQLDKIKQFWTSRYEDCENESQRVKIRNNFAYDLAKFYGSKPDDIDIINEVNLELEKW